MTFVDIQDAEKVTLDALKQKMLLDRGAASLHDHLEAVLKKYVHRVVKRLNYLLLHQTLLRNVWSYETAGRFCYAPMSSNDSRQAHARSTRFFSSLNNIYIKEADELLLTPDNLRVVDGVVYHHLSWSNVEHV